MAMEKMKKVGDARLQALKARTEPEPEVDVEPEGDDMGPDIEGMIAELEESLPTLSPEQQPKVEQAISLLREAMAGSGAPAEPLAAEAEAGPGSPPPGMPMTA